MRRIVIASDGSTGAEEAGWLLAHLPHREQMKVFVLTVLQMPTIYAHRSPGAMSESIDRERKAAQRAYERIAAMFEGANVSMEHILREGHRGKAIVDAAREHNTDLIVLGARGQSTVRRLLLGSISDYVATHAHCSVLVVRPTGIREQQRPIRIAIGYDQSGPAEASLREFCDTQWGGQSEVHTVSVVSYVSAFLHEIIVEADETKAAATSALDTATEQVRTSAPNVQSHLIECDHIGEGLIVFLEEHGIDLVVVGESQHSVLGRVRLGSVSQFVLRHASCSVWVARNQTVNKAFDDLPRTGIEQ